MDVWIRSRQQKDGRTMLGFIEWQINTIKEFDMSVQEFIVMFDSYKFGQKIKSIPNAEVKCQPID